MYTDNILGDTVKHVDFAKLNQFVFEIQCNFIIIIKKNKMGDIFYDP